MKHIATTRYLSMAEAGAGAGGAQAGPTQNGIAQGQCAFDVAKGIAGSLMSASPQMAGLVTSAALGGMTPAGMAAGTVVAVGTALQAGQAAYNDSLACQQLDNASLANNLGIGAIQAP